MSHLAVVLAACAACGPTGGTEPPAGGAGSAPAEATETPDAGGGASAPGSSGPGESPAPADDQGGGSVDPVVLSIPELEALLDVVPDDLVAELDPSLREEGDPDGFPFASAFGGVPVRLVRERGADGAALQALYAVRADIDGDRPILHGPKWSYHGNGSQSGLAWYKDDALHGPVKQWRPIGTLKFERRFLDGQREGLSRTYSKAGKLLGEEIYAAGLRHGPFREWFASGQQKEEAEYIRGQKHGPRKQYSRDGRLLRRENYVNGELDGRWSDFHLETGSPKSWGTFEKGQRTGLWEEGTPEGKVVASREFKAGVPHGQTRIWTPEGTLIEEAVYAEGRKTGPAKTWYATGERQSEGAFADGARTGAWTYWRVDGSINEAWSGLYEDDVRTAALPGEGQ